MLTWAWVGRKRRTCRVSVNGTVETRLRACEEAVEELAEGLRKATGDELMIYEGKTGAGNYNIYDVGTIQAWTFQSGDVRLKV
eukprot:582960-Prorocentrum_minimum.AAC.1